MELRLLALFLAACSGAVGPATPEDTLTDTDLLADTVEAGWRGQVLGRLRQVFGYGVGL